MLHRTSLKPYVSFVVKVMHTLSHIICTKHTLAVDNMQVVKDTIPGVTTALVGLEAVEMVVFVSITTINVILINSMKYKMEKSDEKI